MELIAHILRLQLSYLSKDQVVAVADTILRTLKAARIKSGGVDNAGSPWKRRYGKLTLTLTALRVIRQFPVDDPRAGVPIVEVDATYYALPSEQNARLWMERTP